MNNQVKQTSKVIVKGISGKAENEFLKLLLSALKEQGHKHIEIYFETKKYDYKSAEEKVLRVTVDKPFGVTGVVGYTVPASTAKKRMWDLLSHFEIPTRNLAMAA